MIEFKNVSKTYNGNVKALDNLNFTVGKGELVGFIGPNGSGKTTLMKTLLHLQEPVSGQILRLRLTCVPRSTGVVAEVIRCASPPMGASAFFSAFSQYEVFLER